MLLNGFVWGQPILIYGLLKMLQEVSFLNGIRCWLLLLLLLKSLVAVLTSSAMFTQATSWQYIYIYTYKHQINPNNKKLWSTTQTSFCDTPPHLQTSSKPVSYQATDGSHSAAQDAHPHAQPQEQRWYETLRSGDLVKATVKSKPPTTGSAWLRSRWKKW